MNVPDLFSKVPLFEGLSQADRIALSRAVALRTYRRGERIVTQGQAGDSFFVLVKGRVAVSILSPEGREVVLSTLSTGDHFGEMALLDEAPRSATVTAAERSELAILTREAFFDLLRGNFVIIRALLATYSRRLRHANATIEGLASLDVKGRLARYFRDLAEERGRRAGGGWIVVVRPSQREIADTIGSSRETVSRTMTQLARENLIVPKGKAIYVRLEGEAAAG
jgi:CRP-like cAMP-binding protein